MTRYIRFEDVLEALSEVRCSDCSYEKPLDCSLCQISAIHKQILTKPICLDVVPKAIVNQIFEDIFLCSDYENGQLVVSHDDIVRIKNKFQRRLNL